MAKEKKLPDDCFQHDDKVYKVVLHAVIIPEIGHRTKAEILFDEEAQKALVAIGSSAVEEQA